MSMLRFEVIETGIEKYLEQNMLGHNSLLWEVISKNYNIREKLIQVVSNSLDV